MGGSERISKKRLQEVMLVHSANVRLAAFNYEELLDIEELLVDDGFDDIDVQDWQLELQQMQEMLRQQGYAAAAIAAILSGDGSRGPYNQFQKCTEYFDNSLGWPDRDFRFEYRYASSRSSNSLVCSHL